MADPTDPIVGAKLTKVEGDTKMKSSEKKSKKKSQKDKKEKKSKRDKKEKKAKRAEIEERQQTDDMDQGVEGAGRSEGRLEEEEDVNDFKGPPLLPEMVSYVRQLGEVLEKNQFEDEEEKTLLLDNMHNEMKKREYRLSVNPRCSQILQKVLTESSPEQLRGFFSGLNQGFYLLTTDRCASHVIQTILHRVPSILLAELREGSSDYLSSKEPDGVPSMKRCLLNMFEELNQSWIDLCQSIHGSFLVRDILAIFSGRIDFSKAAGQEKVQEKAQEMFQEKAQLFLETELTSGPLEMLCRQSQLDLFASARLAVHGTISLGTIGHSFAQYEFHQSRDPTSGPILQSLVETISVVGKPTKHDTEEDSLEKKYFQSKAVELVAKLLKWNRLGDNYVDGKDEGDVIVATNWVVSTSSDKHVFSLMTDISGSHLVEVLLQFCSNEVFESIFVAHFKTKLLQLSKHRTANFCVQKLLLYLRTPEQIELCIEELGSNFSELITQNRVGVIWKLVEACGKQKAHEKTVVHTLAASLGVEFRDSDPGEAKTESVSESPAKNFVQELMTIGGGNSNSTNQPPRMQKRNFSVLGSRIAQTLCAFPFHSIRTSFVADLLKLPVAQLVELATNTVGSIMLETFLKPNVGNQGVPFSYRQRLVDRYKGEYGNLSCGRGSFLVEKLFANAGIKRKKAIAKEMVQAQRKMSGSNIGRILLSKCKIDLFRRNDKDWEQEMRAQEKKVGFLSSIINDKPENNTSRVGSKKRKLEIKEQNGKATGEKDKKKKEKKKKKKDKKAAKEQSMEQEGSEKPAKKSKKASRKAKE